VAKQHRRALTGGGLALLGAWFADLRAQPHAHSARVRSLASAVLTATYMVQDCVLEIEVRRCEQAGPSPAVPPGLDTAQLTLYEADLVRTATELAWLVKGSALAGRLEAVRRASTDLVQHWGVPVGEWNTFDGRVEAGQPGPRRRGMRIRRHE
jgi:hypothetical protein